MTDTEGAHNLPNSAGIITGVAAADALTMQGVAGASLQLLLATGLTADRPQAQPATALTGAPNNFNPAPTPGLVFQDTTLSKAVYYVAGRPAHESAASRRLGRQNRCLRRRRFGRTMLDRRSDVSTNAAN